MKTGALSVLAIPLLVGSGADSSRGGAGRAVYLKHDPEGWQRVVRDGHGGIVARAAAHPPGALATPPTEGGSTFEPYVAASVGSWPEAVDIGDLNGDLRNDVALVTSYYFDPVNDHSLFVFLQDATGGFPHPVRYAIGVRPLSVDIGDLNDDGRPDVVVGRDTNGFSILYQDGSGGLGAPVTYPTTRAFKVRIADIDSDTRNDILGIDTSARIDVYLQQPGGGFALAQSLQGNLPASNDLDVGDANGDGRDDAFVMASQIFAAPNVGWFRQRVGGLLHPPAYLDLGNESTHGVAVGDLTGDLVSDVVVTYGGNSPSSHLAVWQRKDKAFLGPAILASYDIPQPVEVHDVTSDGGLDALTAHGGWMRLGVYAQQANGTLAAEQLYPLPYASQYNPHGLAVGDVTGDGAADVAVADYNNGLVLLRHVANAGAPAATPLVQALGASGRVRVAWFPAALASHYRVLRSEQGQPAVPVAETTATRFVDRGLVGGETYTYWVEAVNPFGVALSDPVEVIPRD